MYCRDAIIVPIVNCGTSIFAGFVVFSVLGFMSREQRNNINCSDINDIYFRHVFLDKTGLPVSSVATGGPSLAFITYPEAIGMLPFPQFWAIIFFMMLFFLGLDSVVSNFHKIKTIICCYSNIPFAVCAN